MKEDLTSITIKGIKKRLRAALHKKCIDDGVTMQERVIELIRVHVEGKGRKNG